MINLYCHIDIFVIYCHVESQDLFFKNHEVLHLYTHLHRILDLLGISGPPICTLHWLKAELLIRLSKGA